MSKRIPLTQGKFAIVDEEDYERLAKYKWYAEKNRNTYYAMRDIVKNNKHSTIRMHREILNLDRTEQVHHINHNGLDNRKINLETNSCMIHSHHQPPKGISKYRGVVKCRNKWRARIRYNKKCYNLGYFDTEIEAAKTYNERAKELYGEFACLNAV